MNDADETVPGLKEGDTFKSDESEEPTNDIGKEITNEDSRNLQHQDNSEKVLGENLESKVQIHFVCDQDEVKTISDQDQVQANGSGPHECESDINKAQTEVNNDTSGNAMDNVDHVHVQKNTSVEDTIGNNVDEIQPQSNSSEGDVVKSKTGQIQVQASDDEQGETWSETDKVQEQINLLGQSEAQSVSCNVEGRSTSGEHTEVLSKLDEAEDQLLSNQKVEALNEMSQVEDRSFVCGQDEADNNLEQDGDKPSRIQNNTQCDLGQFEVCPTSGQDEAQCERKQVQDQVNSDEKDDTKSDKNEGQLFVQDDSKIKAEGFMCKVKSPPNSGRDGVLIVKRFPTFTEGKREISIKSSSILAEAPGQAKANYKVGMKFRCDICEVICYSAMNLQMHFLGSKHNKKEADIKKNFYNAEGAAKDKRFAPVKSRTMEDHLSTMKMNKAKREAARFISKGSSLLEDRIKTSIFQKAIIGLDFVTEFQYEGKMDQFYYCQLCQCELSIRCTWTHIFGFKHRINYMKKKHSHLFKIYAGNWKQMIRSEIAEIEKLDGRGKVTVKVVQDYDEPQIHDRITATKDGSQLPEVEYRGFDQEQCTNMETSDSSDPKTTKLSASTSSIPSSRKTSSRAGTWSDSKYPRCKSSSKCDQTRKRQSSQDLRHSGEEWRDEWKQYIKRSKSIKEDNREREKAKNSDRRLESKWNSPESRNYRDDDYKEYDDSSRARKKYIRLKPGNIIKKEILDFLANFKIINDTDARYVERIMYKLSNQLLQFGQRAMQLMGSSEQLIEETKKSSRADEHSSHESQWVGTLENQLAAQPTIQNAAASASLIQNNLLTPSLLNSIRGMDVKTITSTLTRLAANNPAFEGIRISTLVTVLMKAGVLSKSSNKSSN